MAYNTIKIKKYLDIVIERVANAAITPGMLIELMSTNKVRKHANDDAWVGPVMFALEDELQGKRIDQAYAADDQVQCWVAQRGEEVYALLADGENVVVGDKLASNGDGYLKKYDTTESLTEQTGAIAAMALEAVDRSSSSGGDTNVTGRIRVMAI